MKKVFALVMVLALAMSCVAASAAVWPNGSPTVYVGYGAGGGTDTAVRPVIAEMEKIMGEKILVTNLPGANSSIACDQVLASAHDGYSMFATGTGGFGSFAVNEYSTSTWVDWISFHPYTGCAAIITTPSSSLNNIDDVKEYLSNPSNSVAIGALGNGPHTQLTVILGALGYEAPNYALFGSCADAAVAVLAGEAPLGVVSMSAAIDFLNKGDLQAIAVTSPEPFTFATGETAESITTLVEGTENVPMLLETWPIMIPRDTPAEIVEAFTAAFNEAMESETIKEFADSMAYTIVAYTGEDADRFLAYAISGYSWAIYGSDNSKKNPADLGIPTTEEFNWDEVKLQCKDYQ
ncbi:MAG: hypothetical protein IKE30_01165 [Clostridia bacterium]|nr:hypothetical protein [Clostridia bacterium]